MQLRVVLVEPQNPANVGFAARILANFGLEDWAIVGAESMLEGEAARTGAPAREVLGAARLAPCLSAALGDASHTLGFTARAGRHRRPVSLTGLAALKRTWGPEARAALVFGREDRGLDAEEAESLTALCSIPTRGLASLNLSHAVALALWEWFRDEAPPETPRPPVRPGDPRARCGPPPGIRWSGTEERARLAAKVRRELEAAGFVQPPEQVGATLRRLAAMPLEARDLRMLERILRHARWRREARSGPA